MGRGRQKAKHTKLARELKSYSPTVNYSALQAELGRAPSEEELEKWADYAEYGSESEGYADEYEQDRSA